MKKITSISLILLLFFTINAQAELIRLTYSGSIDDMFTAQCTTPEESNCNFDIRNVTSSDFYKGNLISIGDTFSGSFVINTLADFTLAGEDLRQAIYRNVLSEFSIMLARRQILLFSFGKLDNGTVLIPLPRLAEKYLCD